MPRLAPTCALIAALALLAALPAAAPAGGDRGPTAQGAKRCSIGSRESRRLGPTYVLKLSVFSTKCSNGKRLVKAYYRCRKANGGRRGKCRKRVLGYRCSERRFNEIPGTQFDARVTCKKGGRKVKHTYTQFL
jgi:hypothetical protein